MEAARAQNAPWQKCAARLITLPCLVVAFTLQAQNESSLHRPLLITLAPAEAASTGGGAEDDAKAQAAELAKKLQNPIANLISVPVQNNFDWGAGPDGDGFQYKVNVQPVNPFSLSEDWNLITGTILPVVYQENIVGTSSQSGLVDTLVRMLIATLTAFLVTNSGRSVWFVGVLLLMV